MIASAVIGIFCGLGFGIYLLLLLLSILFVIFAYKNYPLFIIVFLVISTNIGLLSQNIAIKMANGNNLVELRDLLILIAIIVGLVKGRKNIAVTLKHPLIWSSCLICLVAFIGALVGFLYGGDTITIIKEWYTLECWILPLVIAANINTKKDITTLFYTLIILGVVIATGANIEVLSKNSIHLVSSYSAPSIGAYSTSLSLSRSIPEGNALIAFSALILLVLIVTNKDNPISKRMRIFFVFLLVYILISSFLIQLRTSVAVFGIGALIFFFSFRKLEHITLKKIILWTLVLATIIAAVIVLFKTLTNYVGISVVQASLKRFENVILNLDSDGRVIEYPFAYYDFLAHPVFGIGFGSDYRSLSLIQKFGEPSATIHNLGNFFLIKMGIVGLIPFIIFVIAAIKSLKNNILLHRFSQNIYGICLSLGLIGLLIQSFVGNVFCLIQTALPPLVIIGLLVSNERIVGNSTLLKKRANISRIS